MLALMCLTRTLAHQKLVPLAGRLYYMLANLKHEDVVIINEYLEYDKVILEDIQILL